MSFDADIIVSGGGIAGLTATLAFARAGFEAICVDPGPAPGDLPKGAQDQRTTAFLQPSQSLLAEIGVWDALAPEAEPLQKMAIADLTDDGALTSYRAFDAADISDRPFGRNLPNAHIRATMFAAVADEPRASLRTGTKTEGFLAREGAISVRLSDGSRLRARLLVAADGRNSGLRQAAGIDVTTRRYGQKALVFNVTHEKPHDATSTEVHRTGGPFTLVPLPAHGDHHRSSVVWMESGRRVLDLAALPAGDFAAAANERSGGVLGHLTPEDPPVVWPIISQLAEGLRAQRLALMAEAAHVVPPIGAQGLNMSLGDIRVLRDLARDDPGGLGDDRMLDAYARARMPVIRGRFHGIDALNRASITGSGPLRDLRAEATKLLYDVAPLRRQLMRTGLG